MDYAIAIRDWRFYISLKRVTKRTGVNSRLDDGNHFLMWDFDATPEGKVIESLAAVQERFQLSNIYLMGTGVTGYYHAYCFTRRSWADTLYILASTERLDEMYFRIGVIRGYFTLRISGKQGETMNGVCCLASGVPETVDPANIRDFCEYTAKFARAVTSK